MHGHWHLDEIYVQINGEMPYLWHPVHHEGELLSARASVPVPNEGGGSSHQSPTLPIWGRA